MIIEDTSLWFNREKFKLNNDDYFINHCYYYSFLKKSAKLVQKASMLLQKAFKAQQVCVVC